jgi:hypothetical protein
MTTSRFKEIIMRNMKLISICVALVALVMMAGPAFAASIRIEPHGSYYGEPIMLTSPATFYVNLTEGAQQETMDPHIFLVMTETSYNSLTGNVVVNWTNEGTPDSITITAWNLETTNVKIPPEADSGTFFNVANLQSHLVTSEPIYWAFEPFLDGMNITQTPTSFTITVPATDPRVAVYILGKEPNNQGEIPDLFNNRNPPTQPGFVVPEPITIAATTMSLVALASYAIVKRKRQN